MQYKYNITKLKKSKPKFAYLSSQKLLYLEKSVEFTIKMSMFRKTGIITVFT